MVFAVEKLLKFVPVVFLPKNLGFVEVDQVEVVVQNACQETAGEQVDVVA